MLWSPVKLCGALGVGSGEGMLWSLASFVALWVLVVMLVCCGALQALWSSEHWQWCRHISQNSVKLCGALGVGSCIYRHAVEPCKLCGVLGVVVMQAFCGVLSSSLELLVLVVVQAC